MQIRGTFDGTLNVSSGFRKRFVFFLVVRIVLVKRQ